MPQFKYVFFLLFYFSGTQVLSAQYPSSSFDEELQQLVDSTASIQDDVPHFLLTLQDRVLYFIKQQNALTRFHHAAISIDLKQLKLAPTIASRNSYLSTELELSPGGKLEFFYLQIHMFGYGRRKVGRGGRKWAKDYETLHQYFLTLYPYIQETHRPNGDRPEEWTVSFYDDATYSRAVFRLSKFQGGCLFRRGILLDYIAKNPDY